MKPVESLGSDPFAVIADDCAEIVRRLGAHVDALAGKSVLITGAAGMLPAYIADTIAHLNDTGRLSSPARLVLVVRSMHSGEGRLRHLDGRKDVQFVLADAATRFHLDDRADYLIHAASPASPGAFMRDPLGTLAVNTEGTRHVLDLAHAFGAASVLFVSTSEVYGSPPPGAIPTPESFVGAAPWLGARAVYAEAKRAGEALCVAAWEQRNTPVKVVRPFHFHGPGLRLDDGRIVAELIRQGLAGEPMTLKSDGRATRTYGYVVDATVGFLRALLSDQHGEAFNVGAAQPETTVLELATTVARLFGRTDAVRLGAAPKAAGSPDRACPDVRKLRERLGVEAEVALEAGLARTIHWHRTRAQRTR